MSPSHTHPLLPHSFSTMSPIVKDGDGAFVATIFSQNCVVVMILGLGLIWALVQGWELTLAQFAIAPVFAITMAVQSRLVSKCEGRNKKAQEAIGKASYEVHFLELFAQKL